MKRLFLILSLSVLSAHAINFNLPSFGYFSRATTAFTGGVSALAHRISSRTQAFFTGAKSTVGKVKLPTFTVSARAENDKRELTKNIRLVKATVAVSPMQKLTRTTIAAKEVAKRALLQLPTFKKHVIQVPVIYAPVRALAVPATVMHPREIPASIACELLGVQFDSGISKTASDEWVKAVMAGKNLQECIVNLSMAEPQLSHVQK